MTLGRQMLRDSFHDYKYNVRKQDGIVNRIYHYKFFFVFFYSYLKSLKNKFERSALSGTTFICELE